MKRKIRTAVIGAGNMGKNHIRIYSNISHLVAIADISEDIGRPLAEKYKTSFYKDYLEMLTKEKPKAVSVVVPTPYHRKVVEDCLRYRIPTLVEKPITNTIKDAQTMLESAAKYKTSLMVGHVERFNPAVVKLKKLIRKGKFGKIISIVAQRVGISFPNTKDCDVLVDLGIHDVDIFNFLLDELPIRIKIVKQKLFKNNKADSASVLLEYKDACCMIQTNWITPIKMRKLYVTGTEGFAEVDYIRQQITLYDKIVEKKKEGNFFEFLSMYEYPKKDVYISKKEPLKEELLYFLDCVQNKRKIDSSYALDALKIVRGEE